MPLGTVCVYLLTPHFSPFLIVLLCSASHNYLTPRASKSIVFANSALKQGPGETERTEVGHMGAKCAFGQGKTEVL